MQPSLAEFIHRQNMRNYTKKLSTMENGPARTKLLSLMAVETARAEDQGRAPTQG